MLDQSASAPSEDTCVFPDLLEQQLGFLSLASKKGSETETVPGQIQLKQKQILKRQLGHRKSPIQNCSKKMYTIKKIKYLENRLQELERENNSLRRHIDNCHYCTDKQARRMTVENIEDQVQQQILGNPAKAQPEIFKETLEFEAIDFSQSLAYKTEMNDSSWVLLGSLMIVMGSKNMGVDGTINTFKILNDCVQSLRRQVQKCTPKISMDFFCCKQEMKQTPMFMEGLDFDPFLQKDQKNGLQVEAVKVENSDAFDLVYDHKITLSVHYESLIGAIETLKENCWISY